MGLTSCLLYSNLTQKYGMELGAYASVIVGLNKVGIRHPTDNDYFLCTDDFLLGYTPQSNRTISRVIKKLIDDGFIETKTFPGSNARWIKILDPFYYQPSESTQVFKNEETKPKIEQQAFDYVSYVETLPYDNECKDAIKLWCEVATSSGWLLLENTLKAKLMELSSDTNNDVAKMTRIINKAAVNGWKTWPADCDKQTNKDNKRTDNIPNTANNKVDKTGWTLI